MFLEMTDSKRFFVSFVALFPSSEVNFVCFEVVSRTKIISTLMYGFLKFPVLIFGNLLFLSQRLPIY